VTLDLHKLETSTSGNWRSTIVRYLLNILGNTACDGNVYAYIVRVVLRLSIVPTVSSSQMNALIQSCVQYLAILETGLQVPESALEVPGYLKKRATTSAPYRSTSLWNPAEARGLHLWGECIESLWSAAMRLEDVCSDWDALTARLLIWRALVGHRTSEVGEWARREVLDNMSTDET